MAGPAHVPALSRALPLHGLAAGAALLAVPVALAGPTLDGADIVSLPVAIGVLACVRVGRAGDPRAWPVMAGLLTVRTLPPAPEEPFDDEARRRTGGFSLHAGVCAGATERRKLERLCRYISRPALFEKRLSLTSDGHVRYRFTACSRPTAACARASPRRGADAALPSRAPPSGATRRLDRAPCTALCTGSPNRACPDAGPGGRDRVATPHPPCRAERLGREPLSSPVCPPTRALRRLPVRRRAISPPR